MAGLPEGLNVRAWYKAVTAIGAAVLLAGAARGDGPALVLGLGWVLIGVGVWMNHPLQSGVAGRFIRVGEIFKFSLIGTVVAILGLGLAGLGGWRLMERNKLNPRRVEQRAVGEQPGLERVTVPLTGEPVAKSATQQPTQR